jgi:fructose-1,6-bisphosphatase/inositol monophosphatase family enzyme
MRLNQDHEKKPLLKEMIGIHFTRSDPDKVHELVHAENSHSIVEKLSRASAGIYAFNSSFIAMIYVAQAALGAYINNTTHLWDIAAGEVLVRACGGKVTDLNKNPIVYNTSSRVSVVAARASLYDDLMRILFI